MNEPPGGGAVPPPSCVAASDTRAAGQENSNVPVNDVECSRDDRKVLYDTDLSYEAYKVVVQLNRSSALKFLSKYKVGKTLAQFASYPNLIVELVRLCRTKILIHCADAATANSLILSDKFPSDYNFFIPVNYVSRVAIIRDIDVEFTEDELFHALDTRQFKLLKVQRLSRKCVSDEKKVSYVPSQSVKLTFAGPDMPANVFLWYSRVPCEPFVQSTIQCFKCLKFGHTSKVCRSKNNVCRKCFQDESEDHVCNITQIQCVNCKGMHNPKSPSCPELERQKKIKQMMSNRNLCYLEAAIMFRPAWTTYAAKTRNPFELLSGSDEEFPSIANKDKRATQKEKLEKYVPPPLPYKSASETKRNISNNITVSRPRKRDLNFEANTSMKKSKNPYSMFEHENLNTGAKVSDLFYEKCAERKLEQQQQKTQVNLDNIANNPRRNLQSNKGFQFQNENINPSDIEMNFDFTKNSTQTSYLAASPLSPDFS